MSIIGAFQRVSFFKNWNHTCKCDNVRCVDNVRFYFFGNCCEKLVGETAQNKRIRLFDIFYIETISRFVFGGIYVILCLPKFEAYFVYILGKILVLICFRISRKNVYAVSISFEFVV